MNHGITTLRRFSLRAGIRMLVIATAIIAMAPRLCADITLISRLSDAAAHAGSTYPPVHEQRDFLPAHLSNSAVWDGGEAGYASADSTSNSSIVVDNSMGTLRVTGDGSGNASAVLNGNYAGGSATLIVLTFTVTDFTYAYSLSGQLSGTFCPSEHAYACGAATAKLTTGCSTLFSIAAGSSGPSPVTLSEGGILAPGTYTLSVDLSAYAYPPPGFPQNYVAHGAANFDFALSSTGTTPSPTPAPTPVPTPSPTPTGTPPFCGVMFSENFDGVTAPALPTGWTASATNGVAPWETSTIYPAHGANNASAVPAQGIGTSELVSPVIAIPAVSAILSFQNLFNLQAEAPPSPAGYDGMVLEISINGGTYTNIDVAGGTFLAGGYTHQMATNSGSPIAGSHAWSGLSAGSTDAPAYITSSVKLPSAARGQNIRLKWRLATDSTIAYCPPVSSVRIDSVVLTPNCQTPTPTPIPTLTPTPSPTAGPSATPTPTATATATANPTVTPISTPSRALNISTRLRVETGDRVIIGGFIIGGSGPKKVAVRGIGPSLANFGITDALADPVLELRDSSGALLVQNDNWQNNGTDQGSELVSLGLAPSDPNESGIVALLPSGAAYTGILSGKNGGTGVGLVEVYDTDQGADSQLANISTRGFVQTGNNVMIGGFILENNPGGTSVVVRGIGPSLSQAGLSNVLADPTLELRDSNGALLITNDNWQDEPDSAAQLTARGLAPQHPLESGIFGSLPGGAFTAILAGKNGGIGVGLVEVYNAP